MHIFRALIGLALSVVWAIGAQAQIQTRLATQCAAEHVDIPVVVSHLQNIKELQLKLHFDNSLLTYDTSLFHNGVFTINNNDAYKIKTTVSEDTVIVRWSAYYGVNLDSDMLLSLRFKEKGNGQATFTWIESASYYKNINGLNIDGSYEVDAALAVPNSSPVAITLNQFTKGCRDNSDNGGCKAQVEVQITGGQAPYEYSWRDKLHQTDAIAIGLCESPVAIVIKDNASCYYGATYDPLIYPAAKYAIVANPEEEVYITKPNVDFSVELEEGQIETYAWDFGDKSTSAAEAPSHAYSKIGDYAISLKTETIDGCDTTVILSNYHVKELNFCIPNVFTPNGDNINDEWVFKIVGESSANTGGDRASRATGISDTKQCSGKDLVLNTYFKSTHLVVLNRNGAKMFECSNCQHNWNGDGAPDGVYFYMFEWEGEYTKGKETGNVTIIGSGK